MLFCSRRRTYFVTAGRLFNFVNEDAALHTKWVQLVKGLRLTPEELAQFAKEELGFNDEQAEILAKKALTVATVLSLADSTKLVSTYGLLDGAADSLFAAFHPRPGLALRALPLECSVWCHCVILFGCTLALHRHCIPR